MPTHSAATQIAASHGYLAQAPAGGARPNTAAPWAVLILLGVTGQSEAATEVVVAVISLFRPPHLNRPSTRRPVTFGASVDADEGILEGGHDADHALPGAPLRLLTSTTNEVVLTYLAQQATLALGISPRALFWLLLRASRVSRRTAIAIRSSVSMPSGGLVGQGGLHRSRRHPRSGDQRCAKTVLISRFDHTALAQMPSPRSFAVASPCPTRSCRRNAGAWTREASRTHGDPARPRSCPMDWVARGALSPDISRRPVASALNCRSTELAMPSWRP